MKINTWLVLGFISYVLSGCSHSEGLVEELKVGDSDHEIYIHSHDNSLQVGSYLSVEELKCKARSGRGERNSGVTMQCRSVKLGCAQVLEKRGATSFLVHLEHGLKFQTDMLFTKVAEKSGCSI